MTHVNCRNLTKVYPSPDMMGKLFALEAMLLNIDRIRTGR
ncbi:Putrescine ABC transporter putrescine-binding protein PotF [Pseudomonas chlororaphis subsp. piscium]|nr:Putrescine ABC transporter putrescine-binding protein PotF [Pseudomonas chlororaphis subsp. piscium]AZC63766.1 Putrescine ABC transporter putrescine-binding protein PotF [Pseudomonas chlororaphis subsp. piscium]AZC70004.1 Putrescine ABC transporter putrescine-binding protein PotF [Pseudomonas chlororaphis subsp. piscium]AZC82479.1 Putrescine ABC transporter putrescine-binding protein PotF [Pseudomonas chlororaphis subsp. piscium]AZC89674.1 Putrescine ABC transporter putrescine-binding protei